VTINSPSPRLPRQGGGEKVAPAKAVGIINWTQLWGVSKPITVLNGARMASKKETKYDIIFDRRTIEFPQNYHYDNRP
jgi:hypothetical protein